MDRAPLGEQYHYCTYCDAARQTAPGYTCPTCGNRLAGPTWLAEAIERGDHWPKGADDES